MKNNRIFPTYTKKKVDGMKMYKVNDFKAYQFYRENSKYCNRELVKDFVDYGKMIGVFYDIVQEKLVESKSGLHLKSFCYLGVLINPTVPKYSNFEYNRGFKLKPSFNLIWVSTHRFDVFKTMTMDKGFKTKIKKKLSENLKKGYEYFFSPSLFLKNKSKK